MWIRRSWVVAGSVLAACAAAPVVPAEPTVPALRFRLFFVESALELSHGGGGWNDCLYLPQTGVMGTVQWTGPLYETPRLHARRVDLAAELASRPAGSRWSESVPEPIRIEAALARRIEQLAALTEQQGELAHDLGSQLVAVRAVGDADSATPEHVTFDAAGRLSVVPSR